jgi:hypothetical protein
MQAEQCLVHERRHTVMSTRATMMTRSKPRATVLQPVPQQAVLLLLPMMFTRWILELCVSLPARKHRRYTSRAH